jgi:hypothetical protein
MLTRVAYRIPALFERSWDNIAMTAIVFPFQTSFVVSPAFWPSLSPAPSGLSFLPCGFRNGGSDHFRFSACQGYCMAVIGWLEVQFGLA